jgi:hypothetical protein
MHRARAREKGEKWDWLNWAARDTRPRRARRLVAPAEQQESLVVSRGLVRTIELAEGPSWGEYGGKVVCSAQRVGESVTAASDFFL